MECYPRVVVGIVVVVAEEELLPAVVVHQKDFQLLELDRSLLATKIMLEGLKVNNMNDV